MQDILKEQQKDAAAKEEDEEEDPSKPGKGIRLGRLKKTGISSKSSADQLSDEHVDTLRSAIQVLCQATNPLGKCMDYVHDDLAAMNKEHERWVHEYRTQGEALEGEKKTSEEKLAELKMELMELDEKMAEETSKVNGVKAQIVKNDSRIDELLNSVVGRRGRVA